MMRLTNQDITSHIDMRRMEYRGRIQDMDWHALSGTNDTMGAHRYAPLMEDIEPERLGYAPPMTDMTRDELNNTLSAIEERMDKRIERMEKDTDRRAEEFRRELELREDASRREQAARDKAMDERFSGFLAAQAERDKRLDAEFKRIADTNAEIKAGISSMKTTSIITAITAAIAIVGGVAAFNATLTSNMLAAFQAGKGEATTERSASAPESRSAPPEKPAQP